MSLNIITKGYITIIIDFDCFFIRKEKMQVKKWRYVKFVSQNVICFNLQCTERKDLQGQYFRCNKNPKHFRKVKWQRSRRQLRYHLLLLQTQAPQVMVMLKERSGIYITCLVLTVLQETKRRVRIVLHTKCAIHVYRVKTEWRVSVNPR